ncbi:DUF4136 domain-containing protein [Algoriphagus sp. CAU 1675]|uniref:DUF4136 domain-containing protein n=1 Tax=Algoriphagus sp. CAU 1675 TaxID=3032597 RepID=UPI0023DB3C0B|nr:DUF4136 domain-containing protein [Algoriphagus sp. CAU 1675]MDF2158388.1 DUF4136 domain-containing protein [Algoriphagus sp. CAU 1675]
MKNFFLIAGILFALASCKVSENITVDQVRKSSDLAEMKTYQVITQKNASRGITQLNRIYEQKLIENGFSPVEENPELFVQAIIASVDFEKEVKGAGPLGTGLNTVSIDHSFTTTGEYGKAIFLIQNAKTNEVLWMGTGTGILSENNQLKKKDIQTALDQLLAEVRQ